MPPSLPVEPPEMIDSQELDSQELKYPDRDYKLSNLEAPDSILSSPGNQATSPAQSVHIKDQGEIRACWNYGIVLFELIAIAQSQ